MTATSNVSATEHPSSLIARNNVDEKAENSAAILNMIVRAATNPDVDVDKMERLMAMHDRIVAKQNEAEFNRAMSLCQAQMGPISADAENKQTRSKFATYAALDRVCRPIYTRHGFAVSFDSGKSTQHDIIPENHIRVICYLGHESGFTRTYHADMPADGKGAKGGDVMTKTHAAGSAYTYGQRYLLKLIFNLAIDMDDDGNSASNVVVSPDQKEQIIALIKEVEADSAAFLKYFGYVSVDAIPAKMFDRAVTALEKKRKKEGEE